MMYGMPPLPARVGCHSPITLQELLPPSPPCWMRGRDLGREAAPRKLCSEGVPHGLL